SPLALPTSRQGPKTNSPSPTRTSSPHLTSPGRHSYSKSSPPPIPESTTPSPYRRPTNLRDSQFLSQVSQELPLVESGNEDDYDNDDDREEGGGGYAGSSGEDEYAGNIDAAPAIDEDDLDQESMESMDVDVDDDNELHLRDGRALDARKDLGTPATPSRRNKEMRQQLMSSMSVYKKKPLPCDPSSSSPVKYPRLYEVGRSSPMKPLPQGSSFRTSDNRVHSHLTVRKYPKGHFFTTILIQRS
ncbi:hypothetical protein BJ508DRAFT_337136, partial [Ascobolus immersus RN42]